MSPEIKDRPAAQDRDQWRVVAFQSGMIAALLAGALFLAATAHAATSTIGRTWPIAEPDALEEIEARVARQPASMAQQFGPRSAWSALKAAPLGRATRNRVRSVVPFYTLAMDIALPGGKILYPKGYTFNPLAYVSLPQRLVVVEPADIGWAARTASPTDWILLTSGARLEGGKRQDDALSLAEKLGRPVFILEERVKQRLGLTVAPVIVRQVGQRLELTEVHLGRVGPQEARP